MEDDFKNKETEDRRQETENDLAEDSASAGGNDSTDPGEELAGHLQRALADYDNLKKEMARREAEWVRYAASGLIEQLIPVMESWRIAEATRPRPGDDGKLDAEACGKWMDGVGHVRQQLAEVLRKAGVTFIDDANVPLDLLLHEPVLVEPREGVGPDTVIEIMEPGVKLHDRVLRPAKVKVAA